MTSKVVSKKKKTKKILKKVGISLRIFQEYSWNSSRLFSLHFSRSFYCDFFRNSSKYSSRSFFGDFFKNYSKKCSCDSSRNLSGNSSRDSFIDCSRNSSKDFIQSPSEIPHEISLEISPGNLSVWSSSCFGRFYAS